MPSHKTAQTFRISACRSEVDQHADLKAMEWKPTFPSQLGTGQPHQDLTIDLTFTNKMKAMALYEDLKKKRKMRVLRSWLGRDVVSRQI